MRETPDYTARAPSGAANGRSTAPAGEAAAELLARAEEWRLSTNLSMQGMYEFLRLSEVCDRSTFSRIWHGKIRAGKSAIEVLTRVVEAVGRHACTVQLVETPAAYRHDPDYSWFAEHLEAVRFSRDTAPTPIALGRMPSLMSQARHAPATFRSQMCVNVLGATAVLFDRPDYPEVPARLSERITAVVGNVVAAIDPQSLGGVHLSCGRNYAGVTLLLAGMPAYRTALIEEGAELALAGALGPHEARHGLWQNTFDKFEAMTREHIPGYERWAERLLRETRAHGDDPSMKEAMGRVEIPHLRAVWEELGRQSSPGTAGAAEGRRG